MNISNLRKKHNIKLVIAMKLKSEVIIAFVLIFLFFGTVGVSTTQAQGIFSASTDENTGEKVASSTENTENTNSGNNSYGLFRDGYDVNDKVENGWGGGKQERESDPKGKDGPVGEGILILSILSGAYAIVKKKIKKIK